MSTAIRPEAARPEAARFAAVSLIAAMLLILAVPADAAEKVKMRGWSYENYGRIIFDWRKKVKFDAVANGRSLTVSFARPMETDLDRVLKYLGGYVTSASLSEDGRVARFGLAAQFDLDSFASGNSVVVDLRRTTISAKPPRGTGLAPLRVRVGRHPGFARLVFDWLDPVDYSVARSGQNVSMRFEQSAVIDTAALEAAFPGTGITAVSSRRDGRNLMFNLTVPATSFIRHFRDGAKIVLDVQQEGGDFGGMVTTAAPASDASGPMVQAISPTGEILFIPAMVGTTVAIVPEQVQLITEDAPPPPPEPTGPYDPLTHYDPNASGEPKDLLLYDRAVRPGGG